MRTLSGWRERLVGLNASGGLVFGLADEIEPALTAQAREGSIIEVSPASQRVMSDIAGRLVREGGVMLVVDYGYPETSFGDSLQAVSRHAYVDPLAERRGGGSHGACRFRRARPRRPRAGRQGDRAGDAVAVSAAARHRTAGAGADEESHRRTGARPSSTLSTG